MENGHPGCKNECSSQYAPARLHEWLILDGFSCRFIYRRPFKTPRDHVDVATQLELHRFAIGNTSSQDLSLVEVECVGTRWAPTWRIIPVRKWLITLVIVSPIGRVNLVINDL